MIDLDGWPRMNRIKIGESSSEFSGAPCHFNAFGSSIGGWAHCPGAQTSGLF